jgi:hypothetical protein
LSAFYFATALESGSHSLSYWCLPAQILVPIANGTEEMEATMIIDILRRAKANVVVASLEDKLEIVASRKVKMIADVLLDNVLKEQYDLILLPVSLMNHFFPMI